MKAINSPGASYGFLIGIAAMVEILQNKNSATRFQVMVEIAASGANIHQKDIAAKLGISPQAVSDYIQQLTKDELLDITDGSTYKISVKGVDWMLRMLRELREFTSRAAQAVTNITVCAAVAERDLVQGQAVGLKMRDGLLFATNDLKKGARGIAVTSAKSGDDVGVANIEGLVEITRGEITILEVPSIQDGGSRKVDLKQLKSQLAGSSQVGAIGIEALVALRRAGVEPDHAFGVAETAIEKAICGLPFLIVCTADAISGLVKKLQERDLHYRIINLASKK